MSIRKIGLGLIPAALVAAATLHTSSAFAAETCVFEKYAPSSAAPFNASQTDGYDTYTYLRGAQLFIPAQEGLTKEWLGLNVQRALANDEACNPTVKPAQVTVTSAASGFWVQLSGADQRSAKSLLRWAQLMVEQRNPQHVPAAAGAQ